MNIYEEFHLQDCPFCGGAGLLEEENGWCWYVMCVDCSNTGPRKSVVTPRRKPLTSGISGKLSAETSVNKRNPRQERL